ncbi:MAG: DUF2868 domain-containing protein [Variovorax paradoxus]|uniref:DUF2868 domain-containing protein n=1 Tax=Variovorax paradoxus TaxID=34073 RepID=A0A2W5RWW5_VARPD|nr:MAG: DUF2868 domain-containing protein [Variovorax paradoxus]
MRTGLGAEGGPMAQAAARAAVLGERLGLQARLRHAAAAAPWVLLGLAAAVVLAGLALAGAVIDGQDRRINVMAALVALLGVHALTFLLWLLALLWPGAASLGALVGRLWIGLTARLALGRGAEGAALLQAGMRLLERARLLPWVLGLASHTVWVLSFVAAVAALLFALAFRQYTLGWETTILPHEVFAGWIDALGVLPGWLGFPVPGAADLRAAPGSTLPAAANGVLAWWLVGCVVVYGLLPRVVAALACLLVWRWRRGRLQPDASAPYYRKLFARFDALAPALVVDPDSHGADWHMARASLAGQTQPTLAVIGFELPPELPWPPQPLPRAASLVRRIDGSAAERQELLHALMHVRPRVLLLACHAASSPDRGTERLLRETLPLCGECRVWLAALPDAAVAGEPPSDEAPGAARWRQWLSATGLAEVHAFTDWARATAGLEALADASPSPGRQEAA